MLQRQDALTPATLRVMATCVDCGTQFETADAAEEYNSHYRGQLEYKDVDNVLCGQCAIDESEFLMAAGREAMDPDSEDD